ncbi:MAG: hypothetical protein IJ672_07580 [Methanobrevibacter sp.]|nr:hypothetical protein [Methanobrevibacter sp.]
MIYQNVQIMLLPEMIIYVIQMVKKCAESNSCENVKVTNIEGNQLLDLCSKYPHCEPGNNNDCINKCNNITNQVECKYTLKDEETFIKCKWDETAPEGKKCQVDGYDEFKSCSDSMNAVDMTNAQCSMLNVSSGKYYRKGPNGCFEFEECNNINVKVEPDICKELTKPDDDLQCIPSENGCTMRKAKCLEKSLYIYDKITCEKLDISSEGYYCLSNGKECIEVNSCDSINDTSYETDSNELKKMCDLFLIIVNHMKMDV